MTAEELNQLATRILDAAFAVHRELGPGLLEGTYHACLVYELRKRGHTVASEVPVPVTYDGQRITEVGYRLDLLVDETMFLNSKLKRR